VKANAAIFVIMTTHLTASAGRGKPWDWRQEHHEPAANRKR